MGCGCAGRGIAQEYPFRSKVEPRSGRGVRAAVEGVAGQEHLVGGLEEEHARGELVRLELLERKDDDMY